MVIFEALEADMPVEPDTPAPKLLIFDAEQLAKLLEDESEDCLDSFVNISEKHAKSDEEKISYKSEGSYLRRKNPYEQECSYDELQKTPAQEDEEERGLFGW